MDNALSQNRPCGTRTHNSRLIRSMRYHCAKGLQIVNLLRRNNVVNAFVTPLKKPFLIHWVQRPICERLASQKRFF